MMPQPPQHVIEDIEDVLEWEPGATWQRLADRLNKDRDHLAVIVKRAGRTDLRDRLTRNARLKEGHAA